MCIFTISVGQEFEQSLTGSSAGCHKAAIKVSARLHSFLEPGILFKACVVVGRIQMRICGRFVLSMVSITGKTT